MNRQVVRFMIRNLCIPLVDNIVQVVQICRSVGRSDSEFINQYFVQSAFRSFYMYTYYIVNKIMQVAQIRGISK